MLTGKGLVFLLRKSMHRHTISERVFQSVASIFLSACFFVPAYASNTESAVVLSVQPGAWVERSGARILLQKKSPVYKDDVIVTDHTGKLQMLFADDTTVAISANSTVSVSDFTFDDTKPPSFKADVSHGVARFITGKVVEQNRDGFSVETPQATVGIRGTTFSVSVLKSGETAVAGIDVNSAYPIDVRNNATGARNQIDAAGQAVNASPSGNVSYQVAAVSPARAGGQNASVLSTTIAATSPAGSEGDTSFADAMPLVIAGLPLPDKGGTSGSGTSGGGTSGGGTTGGGSVIGGGGGDIIGGGGGGGGGGSGGFTAQYSGNLKGSHNEQRGIFSFNIQLNGTSGQLTDATLNMNSGSAHRLSASNGSSAITGGNFDIRNFTVDSTNIPAAGLGGVWMTGGISTDNLSTNGTWGINNADNISVKHGGNFSGARQ